MTVGEVNAGVVGQSAVQGLQLLAGGGQDRDPVAARIVFRPPIGQGANKLIGLDKTFLVLAVIDAVIDAEVLENADLNRDLKSVE